ncbi:MAG: hypothetical protein ABI640_00560 [Gammaproteobacteria bacterium]
MLREIVTDAALLGTGTLFGASLYDAVVLAPNLRGGPAGLEHARLFLSRATPANLFRVASPLAQALLLAATVVNWGSPACRWPLAAAFVALVLNDVITFKYHYPRNQLFFTAPLTVDAARLDTAARQWAGMNYVRVALAFGAWLGCLVAVIRLAVEGRAWPFA